MDRIAKHSFNRAERLAISPPSKKSSSNDISIWASASTRGLEQLHKIVVFLRVLRASPSNIFETTDTKARLNWLTSQTRSSEGKLSVIR